MQKHKHLDDMFEFRKASAGGLETFKDLLPGLAKDLYKVPAVKKLYEKRKDFDLIVTDHLFNEIAYPFVHEVPFITVATPGMDHSQSAAFGNVLNPSYAPTFLGSYPLPMSLWHRLRNTYMHLWIPFVWRIWFVMPLVQKEPVTMQSPGDDKDDNNTLSQGQASKNPNGERTPSSIDKTLGSGGRVKYTAPQAWNVLSARVTEIPLPSSPIRRNSRTTTPL
ncbi:hypothetical protein GWK47_027408 [Chionoecetes opilio]|uniref:Uncharacterized protein n=1 Tax=Chionoecetes opilio TaxID=41210 RepID=A0A8J8WMG3_CHIOP|nr:hypothetical protein GWK47_027408 [Chionoecetes opilio]